MAISKETVKQVTHLARIDLGPEELDLLSGQLKQILGFIDILNRIDVTKIAPMSHILENLNVFRSDKPASSLASEKALENAPRKETGFFVVPKIIE